MADILCTEDMQILRVDLVCDAHAEDILRTYLNLRIHLVRMLMMILRTKLGMLSAQLTEVIYLIFQLLLVSSMFHVSVSIIASTANLQNQTSKTTTTSYRS